MLICHDFLPMFQLVAEGKISRADYLKLAPNKGMYNYIKNTTLPTVGLIINLKNIYILFSRLLN